MRHRPRWRAGAAVAGVEQQESMTVSKDRPNGSVEQQRSCCPKSLPDGDHWFRLPYDFEFKELRLAGGAEDERRLPTRFYERLTAGVTSDLEIVDGLVSAALSDDWSIDRLRKLFGIFLNAAPTSF